MYFILSIICGRFGGAIVGIYYVVTSHYEEAEL